MEVQVVVMYNGKEYLHPINELYKLEIHET